MDKNLISIGKSNLKITHILIIGILLLSFTISFEIRSIPSNYGYELNEFDPFFNYRATEFIVENGIEEYFEWSDELSWYPNGRNVSATSQSFLHIFSALLYSIFGVNQSLYDFVIILPVIFGSLTSIAIFGLVRILADTRAAIISSIMFSISVPLILRGTIGWFKSEPLGIFLLIIALYLLLSGISSQKIKFLIPKIISGGIIFSLCLSAWGGNLLMVFIICIFIFSLPFSKNRNLIWSIPLFSSVVLITSSLFERPGPNFIYGMGGILFTISNCYLIIAELIKIKSSENSKFKNCLLVLILFLIISTVVIFINSQFNEFLFPTFRYLNVINPFSSTSDPLIESISEHGITTTSQSFLLHSSFLMFSGLGIWFLFQSLKSNLPKLEMKIFSLIFGIFAIYVGSTFVRLEVFSSIGLIIFSSIAISEFINIFNHKKRFIKYSFVSFVILLFILPLVLSPTSVLSIVDTPPTIINGGTNFQISSNDWNESLEWLKNNSEEDAIIASWWDYGYWIQTISQRATILDNATLSSEKIKNMAKIFLSEPEMAWKSLKQLEVDYVIIFVAGERLTSNYQNEGLYALGGGGDESKQAWFVRIADLPLDEYLVPDTNVVNTNYFWNNTLLGKMIPFSILAFVDPMTNVDYNSYQPGTIPIYKKDIKFDESDPFNLVYASSSFNADLGEPIVGVFIYEINQNYDLEN